MPDMVESMFSVREVPWHRKGVVLDDYPGREEAMKAAGHNFQLIEQAIGFSDGSPIEGWKALVRNDTGKVMTVCKDSFPVIPNETLWDITDALATGKVDKAVRYETAGVLDEGRILWVLARLEEPVKIPGDNSPTYPYLNVSVANDGTMSLRAFSTNVRTVCWNTYRVGWSQSERRYSIKHTAGWQDRVEEMKEALGMVRDQFLVYQELARELAEMKTDHRGVTRFLELVAPMPTVEICSDRVKANIEDARIDLLHLVDESPTIPDAHRRTGYGLWCAGVEYLDHVRKHLSDEAYFKRCVWDRERMKEKLMDTVKEAVA